MPKFEVLYDEYKDEAIARILLTDDKWNGIIYHYQTVSFVEKDEGEAVLKFEYDIIEAPESLDVEKLIPEDQEEFEKLLGDILIEIITEATERENRTDNSDKSDL